MICPNCSNRMQTIRNAGQTIDFCPECGGTWFDKGELRDVVDNMIAENKVVSPTVNEALRDHRHSIDNNPRPSRKCPVCNVEMQTFHYAYDSNVFLEKCPSCKGLWTDKGEVGTIARYLKGNPVMAEYAKSIAEAYGSRKGPLVSFFIRWQWLLALFAVIINIFITHIRMGHDLTARFICLYMISLCLIWFGDELGKMTGLTHLSYRPITKTTPGGFVRFMGWMLLILSFLFIFLF